MDVHDLSDHTADVRMEHREDANVQSTGNDAETDYENDDLSNTDGDMLASNSPSDNQLTEVFSQLPTASDRDDVLVDGANSRSVAITQSLVGSSSDRRNAELALMDTMTGPAPVDGNRDYLSLHLPSRGSMSPNEDFDDDRDPNYATQRPDTLGAISVAASATAFAGPIYQMAVGPRSWPADPAMVEDTSFADDGTAHLGRRTCGAGMDEVELNQRPLLNNDDENGGSCDECDGSEFCDDDDDDDTGLGSGNQCESTEADQYKMDPEADQSADTVGMLAGRYGQFEPQENSNDLPLVRARTGAFVLGQRRRTDGAVSDTSQDMDDPEEDQADRAIADENAEMQPSALVPEPKPSDATQPLPVVSSDEQKHGALKQHPQSAFSIPKPRVTKSKAEASDSSASCSNRPVPSVRQCKSNTDIVFKPIGCCVGKSLIGKPDSVCRALVMTSKSSDAVTVAGNVYGDETHAAADRVQLPAQDTQISHIKKEEAGRTESNHHSGKPAVVNGRAMWSQEPLYNTVNQPDAVWNDVHASSSVSLPAACYLPTDGGPQNTGTFAAAVSSSQQATPQKRDVRAGHMFDSSSIDMSPIRPASSCGSRPSPVNGSHAVDLASVSDVFPGTELYLRMQGLAAPYSHTVGVFIVFW